LLPSDVGFVQPDPALVPAGSCWDDGVSHPRALLFGTVAEELAAACRDGQLDHVEVHRRTAALLDEMTAGWPCVTEVGHQMSAAGTGG
jgi:hypothetical protein